jgi:CHAT domain-containing protein
LFSQGSEDYEYLRLRDIFGFSLYNTGFLNDNTEKLAQYSIFTKGLLKELRGDSKTHDSSKKTKFGTYILDDIIKENPRIGANTKDILSAIHEKQALVDFIKCDSFPDEKGFSRPIYLALVYSKNNKDPITRVFMGDAELIEEQIRIYNSATLLEGDDEALVSSSKRLYSYLIEPLFPFLEKDIADLIICPDSVLGNVSFGSLPDSSGKFLSETFNIVYVSSPRSLLSQRTQDLGVLDYKGYIFSNPTISQPLNKIFLTGLQSFRGLIGNKELPFSFKEGQEAETFMNSFLASNKQVSFKAKHFSGNQANINNFIGMDNPFLIHMACHGFFNEFINPDTKTISSSGLLLSASPLEIDNKTTTTKYTSTKTFLSPEDIAMCNLNNCYLAIISACDSGRGTTFNGEGLIGLQSSFQRAGVANLLLCLWPIGDKDSYIFMSDLYKVFEVQGIGFESFNKTYKEALRRHSEQHGLANAIRTFGPYIWIGQSVLNTEQGVPKEL